MKGTDANYVRRVMGDFFGVAPKSIKIVSLGEGADKDSSVMWREVVTPAVTDESGELTTPAVTVTRQFSELSDVIAYLTAE